MTTEGRLRRLACSDFKLRKWVTVLYVIVVTTCGLLINPITNPNGVSSPHKRVLLPGRCMSVGMLVRHCDGTNVEPNEKPNPSSRRRDPTSKHINSLGTQKKKVKTGHGFRRAPKLRTSVLAGAGFDWTGPCAVVICRICRLLAVLQLFLVASYKRSINQVFNPNLSSSREFFNFIQLTAHGTRS
jgi:hypothetical protein